MKFDGWTFLVSRFARIGKEIWLKSDVVSGRDGSVLARVFYCSIQPVVVLTAWSVEGAWVSSSPPRRERADFGGDWFTGLGGMILEKTRFAP